MRDPNENPNEKLARRFKADLRRPISERYYSEDELISIFDYGGDNGDDYLRTEALLLGARLYPDSPELLQRRAIFYRGFADHSFDKFIDDNPDINEPLWEILKLGKSGAPADSTAAKLKQYIRENRLVTDEEVIQFVQLAADLGLSDWLYDNIDMLKSKVDYLPTLLYELAASAEIDKRYDLEARLLEQLTEVDPYCADYWRLLAKIQQQLGNTDEAVNSIELALAINPDSVDALAVKLSLTNKADPDFEATARKILDQHPDDPETLDTLLNAISNSDNSSLICHMYKQLFAYIDDCPELIERAITLNTPDLEGPLTAAIERLYDDGHSDREIWLTLANLAFEADNYIIMAQIERIFEAKSGKPLNHDYLNIRAMYRYRQYQAVVATFADADGSGTIHRPEYMFQAYAMFVMSLLRSGMLADALAAAKGLLNIIDERGDMLSPIETYGMRTFLNDVCTRAAAPNAPTYDWTTYDPLHLDKI